jgi:hypothetical protein
MSGVSVVQAMCFLCPQELAQLALARYSAQLGAKGCLHHVCVAAKQGMNLNLLQAIRSCCLSIQLWIGKKYYDEAQLLPMLLAHISVRRTGNPSGKCLRNEANCV